MAGTTKKKKGLGTGLNTLFTDNRVDLEKLAASGDAEEKGLLMININLIDPNKEQPRKKFEEDGLKELADSIKEHGIVEPLIVKKEDKRYKLIAGERRYRAARLANLKEVPVVIGDYTDREVFEIALIENIQRQDLNDIEEAIAYQKLITDYNLRQEEVADTVSKSRTAVTNKLRLLKLDKRVQDMIIEGLITGGHARALLAIEDKEQQFDTAQKIAEQGLTVRDVEKLVKELTNPAKQKTKTTPRKTSLEYKEYEKKLSNLTGTKVQIQQKDDKKGKIVIPYNSVEEFEKIYGLLSRS